MDGRTKSGPERPALLAKLRSYDRAAQLFQGAARTAALGAEQVRLRYCGWPRADEVVNAEQVSLLATPATKQRPARV